MRLGSPSQEDESETKTPGRRAKRRDRRPFTTQSTDEKQISETQKSPNRVKINGDLTTGSATLHSKAPNRSAIGDHSQDPAEIEKSRSATFGEDDFIPFELFDSPDEEDGVAKSGEKWKGKGKAIEDEGRSSDRETKGRDVRGNHGEERDGGDVPAWREGPSRKSEREWDKEKRSHDWGDDRRQPGSQRDMGRAQDGNRKRKYDEYQGDDRDRSRRQRLDTTSKKSPWMIGVDLEKCRNVAEMLHCEVNSFVDWISPTPVEDEIRGLIVDHIAKTIKGPFPDARIFPFGSYLTKLYLPTGDIDLVVLSETMATNDKTQVLHIVATTLKRSGITSHVTIIAKAKVPIIKFVSSYGRFQVDISINQANGLISGEIITGFLKQMIPSAQEQGSKALKSLIMITKAFLSQRNLNEVYTGGLGSYSVVCLAVSFLQMHPKIRRGEIDPEKNLGVLVLEFFELYGNRFNYDNVGISLREGGTYFNTRERGWNAPYKRSVLSIEDPADPSNDISSGSYHFYKVKTAFAGAYNLLTTTSYHRVGILNSRHQGTTFRMRQRYGSEDLSVLSTVMGVTQETINHRRLVQELYDKRVLHRLMGVEPRNHADVREQQPSGDKSGTSHRKPPLVESAWTNGQLKDETDHEGDHQGRHRNSFDQDGGRYDIGRDTKKRRRTQRSDDHVYFVADGDSRGDLSDGEVAEYGVAGEVHEDDSRGSREGNGVISRHTRRKFWLGKAIEIGGLADDSHA